MEKKKAKHSVGFEPKDLCHEACALPLCHSHCPSLEHLMQTQELIQSVNYYRLIIPKLVLEPEKTGQSVFRYWSEKSGKNPSGLFLSFFSFVIVENRCIRLLCTSASIVEKSKSEKIGVVGEDENKVWEVQGEVAKGRKEGMGLFWWENECRERC